MLRRAPLPVRVAVVFVVALAIGAVTSYGQTFLPDGLRSLANSSGSWCAVAFVLALTARSPGEGLADGVLSLGALVSGYYAMSQARGFAVGLGSVLFWLVAACTAGPALGLGAQWLRQRSTLRLGWGIGVLPGVLVGEGVTSLLTVAATTSPAYWVASVLAGVALLVVLGVRCATSGAVWVAAVGTVVAMALAYAVVAMGNPIMLF